MKLNFRFRRAFMAAAVMAAPSLAVGAPFGPSQTQPAAQQPAYGYQPYTAQAAQQPTAYGYPATAPQAQPGYAAAPGYSATPAYTYPPAQAAPTQTAQRGYEQQRYAYLGADSQELPTPGEPVSPTPAPVDEPSYDSMPAYSYPAASATPASAPAADCNCNTGAAGGVGCDAGGCQTETCDLGCYDCGPRRQWFGGLYGLYMTRDRPYRVQTGVLTSDLPPGYYPMPTDTYLSNTDADVGYAAGAEVRFGCTFGHAGCGCNTYQPFAWEVAYWALDDDDSQGLMVDPLGGGFRMYGRINYHGLMMDRYGDTSVVRPVNEYGDYQPRADIPTPDDVRVLANRVRQSFSAQNLELNFWRFGAPAACGVASCGPACGGCDTGSCAPACDVNACCAPPQRFFISGLAGVRFVRFDEYFQNGLYYTLDSDDDGVQDAGESASYPNGFPVGDNNHFLHDIDVDNDLVGFQLGCSMNCLVGCRWSLFCDTNFGIYGNDADVYQRVYNLGDGDVYFASTGGAATVRSSKQDVAFLGEARLGVGYQYSCHCRLTAAWRVLGATGIAMAGDQIPDAGWTNPGAVGYVDTNGSLILHGLQLGVECKY